MWSGLRHPNIVPLLGVTQNFGSHLAMVCPWMNEGNLNHYLDNKKAELVLRRRLQIVGFPAHKRESTTDHLLSW